MTHVTGPDPLAHAGIGDAAASARAVWRADEEEWTRAAVERWHHGRTLLDVVRECMHRGDTVAVRVGAVTMTGTVRVVGDDVVSLASADGRVDFPLDSTTALTVRVVERARSGGTRGRTGRGVPRPAARARGVGPRRRDHHDVR